MDKAKAPCDVQKKRIEEMMGTHGTFLLRMCYVYLRDKALAEDATQDTFVKAYQNLECFRSSSQQNEKAWLVRIAINTCKDYRRSAWFRHVDRRADPEALLSTVEHAFQPQEERLLDEVMLLPQKLKEVVLLHYYQDLTVEEVGRILSAPVSTIYARLKKAKERLRNTLERGHSDG